MVLVSFLLVANETCCGVRSTDTLKVGAANVCAAALDSQMNPPVDGVVSLEQMAGDDELDTSLLREMAQEAKDYLRSFSWCSGIEYGYWGGGVGNVFAIFLFKIIPANRDVDQWLWVVTGDVPHLHLVLDESKSPAEAFEAYSQVMEKWIELAREGKSSSELPPTGVPPTPEWAEELARRLKFLKTEVKPFFNVKT